MFDQDFKWTDDPMAEVLGLSTGTPPVSPNGYFENEYECYQWLFANDAVSDENHASLSYAEAVVNDKAEDAFAVETKPSGVSEVANSTLEGLVDFSGAEIEAFLKDEAPDCFDLCTYLDGTSSNQEINEIISNEPKSEGDATTTDVQTFFAQPIAYPTPTSSPQLNFVNTGSEHENGYIEEIVSEEILEDGEVSTIDQQNFNAKDYNYPSSTSSPSVLFTSPSYYQYPPQQWPQQQFYQPSFAVPGFPANGFNGNFLQWSQHGPVDETPEFGSGKAKKSKKVFFAVVKGELQDQPKSPARISRAQFADHQVVELERAFKTKFYPEPWERRELADRIGLKVRVWFQNRRSKQKRLGPLKPRRVANIDGYA